MKRILLLFCLIFILSVAESQSTENNFISVRGISEQKIDPDRIELTIRFSRTENIKKQNELKQKEKKLIALVKEFSIDLKNLNIDNLSANRHNYYSYGKITSNKINMSKIYKLQLTDVSIADSLTIRLFNIGANEVQVTNLHSDKIEEAQQKAIIAALNNARKKADTISNLIGRAIVKVINVKEYNPEINTIQYSDRYRLDKTRVNSINDLNQISSVPAEDIGIRKILVRYVVDVKYELKNN